MAKSFQSFFPNLGEPGSREQKDRPGSSILFQLYGGNMSHGACGPGYCFCKGGACYNPTGYDSDITQYYWKVPAGITEATFEAWGAGGMGAGASCCQQGVPAGSGAYASKTITVTPGASYKMCLGDFIDIGAQTTAANQDGTNTFYAMEPTGNPNAVQHGLRGTKAYVTGAGLTNFCAEGGNPGATRYQVWAGAKACRNHTSGGWFSCYNIQTMCDVLQRSVGDSANDRYQRACYYGADYGSRGQWGYVQATCCSNVCDGTAPWCGIKMHRHYPGGQIDHWQGWTPPLGGGWVTEMNCAIVGGPYTERAQRRANTATPYARGCFSRPNLIGVGGMSAATCGGTCCYGGEGGPNAIRITYK